MKLSDLSSVVMVVVFTLNSCVILFMHCNCSFLFVLGTVLFICCVHDAISLKLI